MIHKLKSVLKKVEGDVLSVPLRVVGLANWFGFMHGKRDCLSFTFLENGWVFSKKGLFELAVVFPGLFKAGWVGSREGQPRNRNDEII